MTSIILVNMPFADWYRPSFALSQLSAVTRRELGPAVDIDIKYLNFEFARYLGRDIYDAIAEDLDHLLTGVGEWLFRDIAFPEAAGNSAEYFQRYYKGRSWREFCRSVNRSRSGLLAKCEELIDTHDLAAADIVGFTSMFAQHVPSLAMARLIKKRRSEVVTVIGGANCEAPMGGVIAARSTAIDAVFSGPATHTFPEFVRHVMDGNLSAVNSIAGVLTKANVDDLLVTQAIGRDRDIADYIEPDYASFVTAFTAHRDALDPAVRPVLMFETSRGCWWGERSHCTFCGLNGLAMNYRSMPSELALRQFRWLFSFAPWCDEFACTDNILPKAYPKEVFSKLEPPPGVSIFYEVKLPVSEQEMHLISRAGVTKVQPGIEALSTETLRLIGKGTTAFSNVQFLKNCLAAGIDPQWNLLLGFPGEHAAIYEKYMRDIPLLRHLPPPSGAFMVRFDRFSPYFTNAEQYGLDLRPMDFYRLVYPFTDDELAKLAYFFADHRVGSHLAAAITWLDPIGDLVAAWQRCWQPGGHDRPELALHARPGGGWCVIDSRDGATRTIDVDEHAYATLHTLNSPVPVGRLPEYLDLPASQVTAVLDSLRGSGLLFEENDRALSLVTLRRRQPRLP